CLAERVRLPRGSWLLEPASAHDDEYCERDREQDEAQRDPSFRPPLELDVDRQRDGLRPPGEVAGEGDGCAELAERACPTQRGAGSDRWTNQWNRDPAEDSPAGRSECPGRRLEPAVEALQHTFHRENEERHGDERLREHRAGGGEGEADTQRLEELPE